MKWRSRHNEYSGFRAKEPHGNTETDARKTRTMNDDLSCVSHIMYIYH